MFRRRQPLTLAERIRSYAWPRSGWLRASKYVVYRVRRLPGQPWKIALGFACGAFVSFTPLWGLHYLLAAAAAWLLRGSVIASFLGANLGWFYPFALVWAYRLGDHILGRAGHHLPSDAGLHYFLGHIWSALVPTAIGSVPLGAIVGAASFAIVYWVVASYRTLSHRRRLARLRSLRAAVALKESKA